jgi:hypothetical protein
MTFGYSGDKLVWVLDLTGHATTYSKTNADLTDVNGQENETWVYTYDPVLGTSLPSAVGSDVRAPRSTAINAATVLLHVNSGVVPLDPLHQAPKLANLSARNRPRYPRSLFHWEVEVPQLDISVFILPGAVVKNREDRLVVLNRVAA